ncbi:MAG: hypothetical protein IPM55_15760 [Acidobacteria bacterium]|nr:hypothetical protein [Acidobacteriota bacterium]
MITETQIIAIEIPLGKRGLAAMECGGQAPLWYYVRQLAQWNTKAAPGRRTPWCCLTELKPLQKFVIDLISHLMV